jgi:AcrR family transcriptional regulator
MLAIYSEAAERRRMHQLSRSGDLVTDDWRLFELTLPAADCSVAVVRWLADQFVARLSAVRAQCPFQPIVLVTSRDPENARRLKDLDVEEVIWLLEVEHQLSHAVERALASSLLRRAAHVFASSEHLSPVLRLALTQACRIDQPVRTVAALAAIAGCDRRTLWRHWHTAIGVSPELRLEDLLSWLLLLRAAGRKTRDHGWCAAAIAVGVHEHTLSRLTQRLSGRTLRELGADGHRLLAEQFARRVMSRFLSHTAHPDETFWRNLGRSAVVQADQSANS